MPHISVVSPVYQAEGCLGELYRRLRAALETLTEDFEIVLVDDASRDRSWQIVEELARADQRVKGIKLSRNFGQHFAITAGLDFARGDWVVVMDCDLQDQPEEIPKLYRKAREGNDIVLARRHERRDSFLVRLRSKLFGMLYNYLGDIKVDSSVANFSISSQAVIRYVRRFHERARAFAIFLNLLGFKKAFVDVEHAARPVGRSTYTWAKLFALATDVIVSQSNKPLRISIWIGLVLSFAAIVYAAVVAVRRLFFSLSVPGWTSLMVAVSFFSGLILGVLGILGLYLGKVYDEVKGRPLYAIQRTANVGEADRVTG
jgi:polyisoprenyl-phosphate glycosyltransferase